jgi:hypothetical protein
MAKWITASELRDTHILEFQGISEAGGFDGIPIDKLKRYRDGRVRVDVTYIDGTRRRKIFTPGQQVMVQTDPSDDS